MTFVVRAIDGLFAVATVASFLAAVAAMLLTVADIVLRLGSWIVLLATGRRATWAVPGLVDLNQLAIMTCAALAIAVAFHRAGHVGVDLLVTQLPTMLRRVLGVVAGLLGGALCAGMAWTGFGEMLGQIEFTTTSATLGISYVWYWAPLLTGLALASLAAFAACFRLIGEDGTAG
jgi:hypothetical protein